MPWRSSALLVQQEIEEGGGLKLGTRWEPPSRSSAHGQASAGTRCPGFPRARAPSVQVCIQNPSKGGQGVVLCRTFLEAILVGRDFS